VLRLGVSVRLGLCYHQLSVRLGYVSVSLGLGIRLGLIFYVLFVSTKPTAFSLCVTLMSQVAYE